MKSEDKIILFIYLIALTCLSVVFIIIPMGYVTSDTGMQIAHGIFSTYKWYYFIGALIILALNIKLIAGLIFGENMRRVGVIKYTSDGEVNISFDTIKSLVTKTASQTRGIRDIKVMIKPGKENINILIKALIMPDINIPDTVREVQANVKSYIEAMTEIPVGEVKVMVINIASSTKLRLE